MQRGLTGDLHLLEGQAIRLDYSLEVVDVYSTIDNSRAVRSVTFVAHQTEIEMVWIDLELIDSISNPLLEFLFKLLLHGIVEFLTTHHELV